MKQKLALVKQFCLIQLQILLDKEATLRKELQECKLQQEYLQHVIIELEEE